MKIDSPEIPDYIRNSLLFKQWLLIRRVALDELSYHFCFEWMRRMGINPKLINPGMVYYHWRLHHTDPVPKIASETEIYIQPSAPILARSIFIFSIHNFTTTYQICPLHSPSAIATILVIAWYLYQALFYQ